MTAMAVVDYLMLFVSMAAKRTIQISITSPRHGFNFHSSHGSKIKMEDPVFLLSHKQKVRGERSMAERQGLRAESCHFTLQGAPFRLLGGSIHYFRVPRAYWRDRLLKMRACGINTLST